MVSLAKITSIKQTSLQTSLLSPVFQTMLRFSLTPPYQQKSETCNTHCHILYRKTHAFSYEELVSAIKETKNTTPGLDTICYEMFKDMSANSLEIMLRLFNNLVHRKDSTSMAALRHSSYPKSEQIFTNAFLIPTNFSKKW